MSVSKLVEKWVGHRFDIDMYGSDDYRAFERDMRQDLRRQAKDAGCDLVRFNKGFYGFSAVLRDRETGALANVIVSDARDLDRWTRETLVRTMENEKDYTGGPNHYCCWKNAAETALKLIRDTEGRKEGAQAAR